MNRLRVAIFLPAIAAFLAACSEDPAESTSTFTREKLMDPETCKECHESHYDEWAGSMHAYAAEDPVFRAMNAKGQEETKDRPVPLGDFCVKCHAPLAVQAGETTDGLNLDEVPKALRGVTCYFCHQVEDVEGTHNNPLVLANDTTMRGSIPDAVKNVAHRTEYSPLHDSVNLESAKLCGACHDIVVNKAIHGGTEDTHLERTYKEWQESFFSGAPPDPNSPLPTRGLFPASCGKCHFEQSRAPIANVEDSDVVMPERKRHGHRLAGVDVALTDFPDKEAQRAAVQSLIEQTLSIKLCVNTIGDVRVWLRNLGAGHNFPSGATQDRRLWAELHAYTGAPGSETEIFSSERGELPRIGTVVPQGGVATEVERLWLMRDKTFDKDEQPTHAFWDAARVEPGSVRGPTVNGEHPDTFQDFASLPSFPSRVTLLLRLEPVGRDVLDELVAESHLSGAVRDAMPVFDILPNRALDGGSDGTLTWTPESANETMDSYRCAVDDFMTQQ